MGDGLHTTLLLLLAGLLLAACARSVSPPAEPQLPFGAHLFSPESQHAAWCAPGHDTRACEDFRAVPIAAVVRFESQFPEVLNAKGFAREAELVRGYERFYRAVLREGRLVILGTLVCRERLAADGTILLVRRCPAISVTFPSAAPRQVEFLID